MVAEVVGLYFTCPEPVRERFVKRAEHVRERYGSSGQRKTSGHPRLESRVTSDIRPSGSSFVTGRTTLPGISVTKAGELM